MLTILLKLSRGAGISGSKHGGKSGFNFSAFRRYAELYAPCVFIKSFIMYNRGRKEETEWIKSRLANLLLKQENHKI